MALLFGSMAMFHPAPYSSRSLKSGFIVGHLTSATHIQKKRAPETVQSFPKQQTRQLPSHDDDDGSQQAVSVTSQPFYVDVRRIKYLAKHFKRTRSSSTGKVNFPVHTQHCRQCQWKCLHFCSGPASARDKGTCRTQHRQQLSATEPGALAPSLTFPVAASSMQRRQTIPENHQQHQCSPLTPRD